MKLLTSLEVEMDIPRSSSSTQFVSSSRGQSRLSSIVSSQTMSIAQEEAESNLEISIVQQRENEIYALNNQIIALNKVINAENSQIAFLQQTQRMKTITNFQKMNSLNERKAKVVEQQVEYDKAQASLESMKAETIEYQERIAQQQQELSDLFSSITEQYKVSTAIDPTIYITLNTLQTTIERLKETIQNRKDFISHNQALKTQNEQKLLDLAREEEDLRTQYSKLNEKSTEIDQRVSNATLNLSDPSDILDDEVIFVSAIEEDLTQLKKQLESDTENQIEIDLNEAQRMLDELNQSVVDQQNEIDSKRRELDKIKINARYVSLPPTRETAMSRKTKSKKSSAQQSSVQLRAPFQHKIAEELLFDIFAKLEDRRVATEEENDKLNQLQADNEAVRPPIEEKWKAKMERAAQLAEDIKSYDSLIVDVAVAEEQRDNLKKIDMELGFKLARIQREVESNKNEKTRIEKRKKELQNLKDEVEKKKNLLPKEDEKINERKKKIEEMKAEILKKQELFNEREKQTLSIEAETDEFIKDADIKVKNMSNEYQKLSKQLKHTNETSPLSE